MRMRKKPNLEARMERCRELMADNPKSKRGHWRETVPKADALFIELGCGKGRFTVGTARRNPNILFVAVERVPDAMVVAMERCKNAGLENVLFIDGDASVLCDYFAPAEADRIYINFCDPWPPKGQAKRRLTHRNFLSIYRNILKDGGEIHFKTDNRKLFDFSLGEFSACDFELKEVTENLHATKTEDIMTDYEAKFVEQGKPICRCIAVKMHREPEMVPYRQLPPEYYIRKREEEQKRMRSENEAVQARE